MRTQSARKSNVLASKYEGKGPVLSLSLSFTRSHAPTNPDSDHMSLLKSVSFMHQLRKAKDVSWPQEEPALLLDCLLCLLAAETTKEILHLHFDRSLLITP
jgi:hypothetical protein